jgi:putative nucleotidyltransferase with HDIG domain
MRKSRFAIYDKLTSQIAAEEFSTLLKVSSALASTLDLKEILQIAIESTVQMLGVDTGAIYTLQGQTLLLGATVPSLPPGFPEEFLRACLDNHPHIKQAVTTRKPVYLHNTSHESLSAEEKIIVDTRHLVSMLYFPLLLKETAIGAFIVGTTGKVWEYSKSDMDLSYILSYQVSLAIANAQLYARSQQAISQLTQAYDATLESWSRVLDMRDHVTDKHTQRVADLTVRLARRMGVPESELQNIRRGALLHDIGKMGIPDHILQNPSSLSEAERDIMQSHPQKAHQLISQIDYLASAIDIPYCHHEKWDGTGYPRGLQGEGIPLAARIFAVIDVYDALTTDRPYRSAWSQAEALQYIQEQSGKHFYPLATQAFIDMMNEENGISSLAKVTRSNDSL